jgi:hypothetical protein
MNAKIESSPNPSKIQMRPCKPGDVLARAEVPCGAFYEIRVVAPAVHPPSGVSNDHNIECELWLGIPSSGVVIRQEFVSECEEVMGENLKPTWGFSGHRTKNLAGLAVAPVVEKLAADGAKALAIVQGVYDRHQASRAAQQSARDTAYAAWPVVDSL